jgi:hypothetical protein
MQRKVPQVPPQEVPTHRLSWLEHIGQAHFHEAPFEVCVNEQIFVASHVNVFGEGPALEGYRARQGVLAGLHKE